METQCRVEDEEKKPGKRGVCTRTYRGTTANSVGPVLYAGDKEGSRYKQNMSIMCQINIC